MKPSVQNGYNSCDRLSHGSSSRSFKMFCGSEKRGMVLYLSAASSEAYGHFFCGRLAVSRAAHGATSIFRIVYSLNAFPLGV